MHVYLVRHGIAEDAGPNRPDSARALTDAGTQKMRLQVRAMAACGLVPDRLMSSPLVRARQTAEILSVVLNVPVEEDRLLSPGASLADLQELLARYNTAHAVMVVGHQPDLGEMVRQLTGAYVKMRKGMLAHIRLDRHPGSSAVLHGLYDPDHLAVWGTREGS